MIGEKIIGEKIKSFRTKNGLTQRELSRKISYSPSYIGDLENGRTNPSIKTLEAMAECFEIEVSQFFESTCCYKKALTNKTTFCFCQDEECKDCPIKTMFDSD